MTNYAHLLNCNARAELARRNFEDFVLYMHEGYEMQWFHKRICETLDAFERGDIKKLLVCMPPQHGKSQLTTRLFPAYLLGKNGDRKCVVSSYSATLSSSFNRDIQRVIDTEKYHDVFPEIALNESNVVTVTGSYLRNSEIFEIVGKKGFLKTVGRGGSLTGTPVDIGIIDDPLKDRAEAMSQTIRDGLWSWYKDVFETRLHNDSRQIVVLTRWHEEDLAGKLLERDGDQWHQLIFEGISETNLPGDIRGTGEALWPSRHSLERLEAIRESSPLTFNSLYQQTPKPYEGQGIYWNRGHINYGTIEGPNRTVVAIDPAATSRASSDETGIVGACCGGGFYEVMEDRSGKYSPSDWAKVAIQMARDIDADCIVGESNMGGEMIETILRSHGYAGRVQLVNASKGKAARAEPIFALYEQGKVMHRASMPQLEKQMVTFHPDMGISPDRVDAMVWALWSLSQTKPFEIGFA